VDFFKPITKNMSGKKVMVCANYFNRPSKDIMIKGQDFYAVWNEEKKLWSTDIYDAAKCIDDELIECANDIRDKAFGNLDVNIKTLTDSDTKGMDDFKHWYQKQAADSFKWLNSKVIFADDEVTREDYASFKLPYSMKEGDTSAWDELVGTLYSPEEKRKIEYAIGSIISGESKRLQKLFIFVGDAGTGKSTVLSIIREMFRGYTASIDIKSIGMGQTFALESLRENPLIAIQDDVDLSKIEDNARLNSIISHENIMVNEKHKSQYNAKFHTMIFAGTNREVCITDARSGLLRRIIDIEPTGQIFSRRDYDSLMDQIPFEYGAIAYKCLQVFNEDPGYYNRYYPVKMIRATNRLYNFIEECHEDFLDEWNGTTLAAAWECYNRYCELSELKYKLDRLKFKTELKDYFKKFAPDTKRGDKRYFNYYSDFRFTKIGIADSDEGCRVDTWLKFSVDEPGIFDYEGETWPAQLATSDGIPSCKWDNCKTILKQIDPRKLHYVKVPENHIVIDFDLKDPETGEKSFELNMVAASKWPKTYAELSKSGAGIHLHYIYDGDVSQLANVYDKDIEVKVFTGGSSLRRKFTSCVNLPIATINSGLPLKEEKKMVEKFVIANEKALRTMIMKNLNKEYHPGTKPSVDYIYDLLEDAYKNGVQYDISDLRPKILAFANNSSNHSEYCVKLVSKMHFYQDVDAEGSPYNNAGPKYADDSPIIFFDVEVFPNLFVICWKKDGVPGCVRMINPTPDAVQKLTENKLVGFNNRRYDNHILWARILGYSEEQLYKLSQKIVNNEPNALFMNAYGISYTDIYDFSSAGNKQSLKKWEIQLGIHHLELGLPWDQPVPEELWDKVAEYCCNDVESTEATFHHLESDWVARQILADISGLSVNHSTNQHSTKIIFGDNKHPQSEFCYRDLSKPVTYLEPAVSEFLWEKFPEMMKWWSENTDSLLPYFPGYTYDGGKSIYKGVEVGEGGYVESLPGMYGLVGLLDIASMHPHSAMAECAFGPRYTRRFRDIVDGRISVKHEDWSNIDDILDGVLAKYVPKVQSGEITSKALANALKTVINSVYGLTKARFENAFRDPRNKDNIIAKRGALFMVDLAEEVKKRGFTVAHIKTDSIKIPDITQEMVDFVMEFGKRYGYTFEWEATYDKMCLVNDAVYIAKYADGEHELELSTGEKIKTAWTPTGAEFADPYIFKKLFAKKDLVLADYAQTKEVKSALYLDMNEDLGDDEHAYKFVGKVGSFLPIKEGCGGGILLRDQNGKMYSAEGAKGYRWLETEVVKQLGKEDDLDISYYVVAADKAVEHIEEFGSFNWLVDPTPYDSSVPFNTRPFQSADADDEVPWDEDNEDEFCKVTK